MGELAGSLAAILMMAQPGADVDLGSAEGSTETWLRPKKSGEKLVRHWFQIWVMWGYNPTDFWKTHPTEFFWVAETKIEMSNPPERYAGGMNGAEVAAIYADAYGDE